MERWDRIRGWVSRAGWRAHAPLGGSIVLHGCLGFSLASLLFVARPAIGLEAGQQGELAIELALVAEAAPLPERPRPKLRQMARPRPRQETLERTSRRGGGVLFGPASPGEPLGLAGLTTTGLGGLHDTVGRLGFNPDLFDRGFGD